MTNTTLTKTAALRTAQAATGRVIGSRTSWSFYAPHSSDALNGPTTQVRGGTSCRQAVTERARWVAALALELMGYSVEDASYETHTLDGSAAQILNAAIAKLAA